MSATWDSGCGKRAIVGNRVPPHRPLLHRFARLRTARDEARRRLEERDFVNAVLGHAGALVVVLERDGRVVRFNPAAERASGVSAAEAVGKTLWELDLVPPEQLDNAIRMFGDIVAGAYPSELEAKWVARDGTHRRHIWSNTVLLGPDAEVSHVIAVGVDVTAQRAAEAALRVSEAKAALAVRASEARLVDAFHYAPVGMALVSLEGRLISVNRALCEISGHTREQLEATSPAAIIHAEDLARIMALRAALLSHEIDHYDLEVRCIHAQGHTRDVALHVTLARDINDTPTNFVAQVLDITERKQFEAQLQHMADHDSLTGLYNRRRFKQELERHVLHVQRYGFEGAVLVLDIDNFKQINDSLGHQAGDQLINFVGDLLRTNLRATDVLARLGGDEFAILLPKSDRAEAKSVADKLVTAVRNCTPVLHGDHRRSVSISVGVAMFDRGHGLTADDAIVDADLAMYEAKDAGRDRFVLSDPNEIVAARASARLSWLERIERAIDDGGFVLEAQPVLDLTNNRVVQHELLIRMLDGAGDRLPPASFLGIAERHGLITRIDTWVAGEAISMLRDAERRNLPRRLEVNVSGKSITDHQFVSALTHELAESGVDPSNLILQVSEGTAMADIQAAKNFAWAVHELGCRFAIDDFGAGYGSFYSLKHLPFDYLKIDGEFIRRCLLNRTDQLVITAVVGLARGLGKQTIAEFVPDAATCALLVRLGVDLAQGVHIGMPKSIVPSSACRPGAHGIELAGTRRRAAARRASEDSASERDQIGIG